MAAAPARRRHRLRWWIVGGVVVLVVLLVGGPFVYIHLIEGPAPPKLALPAQQPSRVSASSASSTSIDGRWNVSAGSQAGYRVQEVLVGQHSTAVGRSDKISGAVQVTGDRVTAANFSVDMASVQSDQSARNAQFDGRIMDVGKYPTARFVLGTPIALGSLPGPGVVATYPATGHLTMHGVTREVSFRVSAERSGSAIDVLADVHIVFSEWNIANPSIGGFVTTASDGTLEVLLHLRRGPGSAAVSGTSAGAPSRRGLTAR